MKKYAVILRGSFQDWNNLAPEETQKVMENYGQWVSRLKSENRYTMGNALTEKSRMLKSDGGTTKIIDGPYAETKEAVTGFFLIEAKNHSEAVELSKDCPALTHGDSVEVIELSQMN
jgi:hypothetical protein